MRALTGDHTETRLSEIENAYKLSQELAITLESAGPKALGRIAGIVYKAAAQRPNYRIFLGVSLR